MIHFDFIVDDIDAENIMDCLQEMVVKMRLRSLETLNTDPVTSQAYEDHSLYIEELKKKMTHRRLENVSNDD